MKRAPSVSSSQPPAPPAIDPAEAERAGRMLDRLAEMAMEQAEATHQALLAAVKAGEASQAREFGLAHDRAARGVRRAVALKLHFAQKAREAADRAAAGVLTQIELKDDRRRKVARLVTRSITAETDRPAESARLATAQMWRRLLDDPEIDASLALAAHPIEEIVLRLCREMGIDPQLILPDETGRPPLGRPPKEPDKPPAAWVRPTPIHPEAWRYIMVQDAKDGEPDGEPYWWDVETEERIDRPPWETGGD